MIRQKQERQGPIIIDLIGPEGNAFYLIGLALNLAKQIGWSEKAKEKLQDDMMSSDYENLLQVFDKHFGDFVILER
jgi:hypothetical protein